MFNLANSSQSKPATLTPITPHSPDGRITFTQKLTSDIAYIGVKAVNSKTG
jgi:hypothetical protein